ncbi:hypothetical protein [Thermogemmatispora sp.]|uniref:hypothetical protein n=1 Tax=Thermogemmatispora sp. TaxID=1968838 RepID=UPI0035E3FE73
MKLEGLKAIADAVLYEGYLLYPYRQSAIKNRHRWTYGVLYPRAYSEAGDAVEPWCLQCECLLEAGFGSGSGAGAEPRLAVHVRFLQLMRCRRQEEQTAMEPERGRSREGLLWADPSLVGCWEEGVERTVSATGLSLAELLKAAWRQSFAFPARRLVEEAPGDRRPDAPRWIVREGGELCGEVSIAAEALPEREGLFKLRVIVANTTPMRAPADLRAEAALLSACVSTHAILQLEGGAFVSLIEPPEELRQFAASCHNSGTWPVLVGEPGQRDSLLSAPIILYDYPQIAPESPAALFDGTEIDELLALRIMTLTDEEKEQIRQGDARGRAILEQIERMTPEQLLHLHGTIRDLRSLSREEGEP